MGLISVAGKKNVHPSAVVRGQIKRRMKEALRLVVTRGARVDHSGAVVLDKGPIGEADWLMKGLQDSPLFRRFPWF